jgi:hypothetical protein
MLSFSLTLSKETLLVLPFWILLALAFPQTPLVQCGGSTNRAGGRKTFCWSVIKRRSDS